MIELIYARHNLSEPAHVIMPQLLPYHELTVVIRGTLTYYIDGVEAALESGDAVFGPRGARRERTYTGQSAEYLSFNFQMDPPPSLPTVIRGAVTREVQLLIAAFDEFHTGFYLDDLRKTAHLLECILLSMEEGQRAARFNPLTRTILRHLHDNFRSRITLADISALTAFSPVYCDSVFRQETGRSIIDYLIDVRIGEAKKLLVESSVSMSRIAELTGFQDANYFSRVFKKRTGDTPSGYRKRLYGGHPPGG